MISCLCASMQVGIGAKYEIRFKSSVHHRTNNRFYSVECTKSCCGYVRFFFGCWNIFICICISEMFSTRRGETQSRVWSHCIASVIIITIHLFIVKIRNGWLFYLMRQKIYKCIVLLMLAVIFVGLLLPGTSFEHYQCTALPMISILNSAQR